MDNTPYMIPAKATEYNGRIYRSRLEARVAAYYDILGLSFEYEPMDYPKWSPDFLVTYNGYKTLIEVKYDNSLFNITKYLDVDFNHFNIGFMSQNKLIIIGKNKIDCKEHKDISEWIEAGNKVMFLKPQDI